MIYTRGEVSFSFFTVKLGRSTIEFQVALGATSETQKRGPEAPGLGGTLEPRGIRNSSPLWQCGRRRRTQLTFQVMHHPPPLC